MRENWETLRDSESLILLEGSEGKGRATEMAQIVSEQLGTRAWHLSGVLEMRLSPGLCLVHISVGERQYTPV